MKPWRESLPSLSSAAVYDMTNIVGICLVGAGVWTWIGVGPALVVFGGLMLLLNVVTMMAGG